MLGTVAEAILTTLEDLGTLTLVATLPDARKVFRSIAYGDRYRADMYCRNKLSQLISTGLVKRTKKDDGTISLQLTKKGEQSLHRCTGGIRQKTVRRRWDGKWRIVMFDIWESSRPKRDKFRRELKVFGFMQLQRSVWIYPYDCEEYVTLLRTDMKFGKNIRYIVAEHIDGESALLKSFTIRR